MHNAPIIIIGSGLSGIHAAHPLVEAGHTVLMLDVGLEGADTLEQGPGYSFEKHRTLNPEQHDIFLGNDLSGIGAFETDSGHAGTMTSGRRAFVVASSNELQQTHTENVVVVQSLAQGGLSEAWGAVCGFLNEEELNASGMPAEEMRTAYEAVIDRIGVSGKETSFTLMPEARVDDLHEHLRTTYAKNASFPTRYGFALRQPALALLTKALGDRLPTEYRDMDYWDNIGRSIYRGHYSLEALQQYENFTYHPGVLVETVHTDAMGVSVQVRNLKTNTDEVIHGSALIMAAGAVNTTRILLRSFNKYDTPVPIMLKDNYLIPALHIGRLGKEQKAARHSLCQLVLESTDSNTHITNTYVQLYSYRSLLLHKLLRYAPLSVPETLSALALLTSAIVLADVRFPSGMNEHGTSTLKKDASGKDVLAISYEEEPETQKKQRTNVRQVQRALRGLGLMPLATIHNPRGSTSHYAGGIPYTSTPSDDTLSVNARGQLHQEERIFVADAATWTALPAKPPALTMMANAHRIGTHVRNYIQS